MASKPNNKLISLTKAFFQQHYPNLKTGALLAREFKKVHSDIDITYNNLRQHYFAKLIKGENIESIDTEQENTTYVEETKDGKFINYKGEKPITSLEEAISFFEIDTKVWEVDSWKCKSWDTSMNIKTYNNRIPTSKPVKRTNYAVTVNLKRKISTVDYDKIYTNINELYKNYPRVQKIKGANICTLTISDIHIGLKVTKKGGIINTPEFDVNTVIAYLNQIAAKVNSFKYEEVHVFILGDLVESVSGYNHIETLKEMESTVTGGNIIILAYEILSKFLAKINNLKKVYMISGNHDRLTPDKAMDKDGGACQLISYMLQKIVDVEWHPILIKSLIDNINYILTHGHLKISQQDLGKIFFEYGDQNKYNVMISGHWHIRKTTKVFQEKNILIADTLKYRSIIAPPITSGTRWTEENGWSGNPGFLITESNNSKNNINQLDYALD